VIRALLARMCNADVLALAAGCRRYAHDGPLKRQRALKMERCNAGAGNRSSSTAGGSRRQARRSRSPATGAAAAAADTATVGTPGGRLQASWRRAQRHRRQVDDVHLAAVRAQRAAPLALRVARPSSVPTYATGPYRDGHYPVRCARAPMASQLFDARSDPASVTTCWPTIPTWRSASGAAAEFLRDMSAPPEQFERLPGRRLSGPAFATQGSGRMTTTAATGARQGAEQEHPKPPLSRLRPSLLPAGGMDRCPRSAGPRPPIHRSSAASTAWRSISGGSGQWLRRGRRTGSWP
jgi:hypothetical protein